MFLTGRMTVREASQKGRYCTEWVRVLIRAGKVISVKEGKKWYISISSFNFYLDKQSKTKRRGRPKKKG